jgi:hypothetical protein
MLIFENIAEQEGWTPTTQVEVLLEYIENQQSEEAFNDFVSEKIGEVEGEENLGLSKAIENLAYGNDRHLYKCAVGVYATVDSENPIAKYEAFVTEQEEDEALEQAVTLCESEHGHKHEGLSFAAEGHPIIVDRDTLKEID